MNYSYTIPNFPRYTIDRSGTITDSQTGEVMKPIPSSWHSYSLYNANGKKEKVSQKALYRSVFNVEYCVDNIPNLEGEAWKPVENTHGKYFVSNMGRVKSLVRYKARILQQFDNMTGYQKVFIFEKPCYIHRLVAAAFLGKPEPGKDTIHHKNHNRKDNRLENLEYLSLADNIREAKAWKKDNQ